MSPKEIRFSHDKIHATFRDGRTILQTYQEFLFDEKKADELETIIDVVRERDGIHRILKGNRRLFLFQELQENGFLDQIPVRIRSADSYTKKQFDKKNTTKNDGMTIEIRDEPRLKEQLKQLSDKFKNEQLSLQTVVRDVVMFCEDSDSGVD